MARSFFSMNKLIDFLTRTNRITLILALISGNVIVEIALIEFLYLVEPEFIIEMGLINAEKISSSISLAEWIILAVFVGPFIETLIFQYLLLLIVKKFMGWVTKSSGWSLSFLIVSIVFSFAHSYNFGFNYYGILNAVLVSAIASSCTVLAIVEFEKKNGIPITSVFILHGSYNLVGAILIVFAG